MDDQRSVNESDNTADMLLSRLLAGSVTNELHKTVNGKLDIVHARVEHVESLLVDLMRHIEDQKSHKEWYTTAEFASLVNRDAYTVRGWCRSGRIESVKSSTRCGASSEYRISHTALLRYRAEGLLPDGIDS